MSRLQKEWEPAQTHVSGAQKEGGGADLLEHHVGKSTGCLGWGWRPDRMGRGRDRRRLMDVDEGAAKTNGAFSHLHWPGQASSLGLPIGNLPAYFLS